jgi:hypothetical protein
MHKQRLPSNFYALDIDLAFVEKNHHDGQRDPHITAVADFKRPSDRIKFTQALAYSRFLHHGIPVYIIKSQSDQFNKKLRSQHRFDVYRYDGGDYRPSPPECDTTLVEKSLTWSELEEWESQLRINRRKEVRR